MGLSGRFAVLRWGVWAGETDTLVSFCVLSGLALHFHFNNSGIIELGNSKKLLNLEEKFTCSLNTNVKMLVYHLLLISV